MTIQSRVHGLVRGSGRVRLHEGNPAGNGEQGNVDVRARQRMTLTWKHMDICVGIDITMARDMDEGDGHRENRRSEHLSRRRKA